MVNSCVFNIINVVFICSFTIIIINWLLLLLFLNQNQAPEQRFASQLEQLASMGFIDREANIRGELVKCIAIERFLQINSLPPSFHSR